MLNARRSALLSSLKKPLIALASLALPLAVGSTGILSGCGSDTSSGGTAVCFDYTTFKADNTVTFSGNVLPIFRKSCGLSASCHGAETPTNPAQHYLGPAVAAAAPTPMQIDAIFAQSVGVASVDEPDMNVVHPGQPDQSFLMYKLDGLECATLKCIAAKTCLTTMPQNSPQLSEADRNIIRSWIKNGAQKN